MGKKSNNNQKILQQGQRKSIPTTKTPGRKKKKTINGKSPKKANNLKGGTPAFQPVSLELIKIKDFIEKEVEKEEKETKKNGKKQKEPLKKDDSTITITVRPDFGILGEEQRFTFEKNYTVGDLKNYLESLSFYKNRDIIYIIHSGGEKLTDPNTSLIDKNTYYIITVVENLSCDEFILFAWSHTQVKDLSNFKIVATPSSGPGNHRQLTYSWVKYSKEEKNEILSKIKDKIEQEKNIEISGQVMIEVKDSFIMFYLDDYLEILVNCINSCINTCINSCEMYSEPIDKKFLLDLPKKVIDADKKKLSSRV